jgi:hypothetical protein
MTLDEVSIRERALQVALAIGSQRPVDQVIEDASQIEAYLFGVEPIQIIDVKTALLVSELQEAASVPDPRGVVMTGDGEEGLLRGIAALHASGRLRTEGTELDKVLVLAIVDAVFSPPETAEEKDQ